MVDSPNFSNAVHLGALILAAGKGTRMHSEKPKVLQKILEEPMLRYIYDAVTPLCPRTTWTVIGHRADLVEKAFPDNRDSFILQEPQNGTGHALQVAMPALIASGVSHVLIVNGDTPLIPVEGVRSFVESAIHEDADLAFISLVLKDPGAFGRVVRKDSEITAIVEAKDYDPSVHGPVSGEINAGIYCINVTSVEPLLSGLSANNKSGELYLTDLVGIAVGRGMRVLGFEYPDGPEYMGINNPFELVNSEESLRAAIIERHLKNGVIIRNAGSVRIGPDVVIAPGVDITGPAEIYGKTSLGSGCVMASHNRIQDAAIDENVTIHSFCHMQEAVIKKDCTVGPYARLRPGAVMEESAHVGNFVEMKKAHLGKGAKANHLTYLGDARIGAGANIGAGTITCNYDGVNKHLTVIGEKAFIGSNTALVAPVSVGDGAVVGAGSVITKEVPEGELAVARGHQRNIRRRKE